MLIALQIDVGLRGVKRICYACSSIRFRTPSIQPTQSASSTASDQPMLGRPEPTLWKPTISSIETDALAASHCRNWVGVAKN